MGRGRPRSFDEDQVLDAALEMFVANGYDGVCVAAICDRTGVAPQSLYNAFGDKAALYQRVLERYGGLTHAPAVEALLAEPDPLVALRRFASGFARHASTCDGCLFARVMAEAEPDREDAKLAQASTARLRKALRARAREAADAGRLPDGADPGAVADTLLALAVGVAVVSRGGMPAAVVKGCVREGLRLLGDLGGSG
ncbi:MAG: TetR/AcrR family transcriptional regulator [Planctomycetota bacterium]